MIAAVRDIDVVAQVREYDFALLENADRWVPACGGTEIPTMIRGIRYLYCYNPYQRQSAYINLATDMVLSQDETMRLIYEM